MQLRRHLILIAALAALLAASAQAGPNTRSHTTVAPQRSARAAALVAWKPRAWTPATPAASAQGFRVAIDPVDGAFSMPAADELSQQAVITDDTPVPIERAADGTVTARLDDRFAQFAMARVGADGKPVWTCVPGKAGAAKFMKQPPAPVVAPSPAWEVK